MTRTFEVADDVRLQDPEPGALGAPPGCDVAVTGVDGLEVLARCRGELHDLLAHLATGNVCRVLVLPATRGEPALDAEFLDGRGERLVETGVALDVDDLVRQLMKQHGHELHVVPAQHRAQDRVPQLAERRIRRHAADRDIETARSQPPRLALGVRLLEIAAVADAARDRETPGLRLQRKLGRREDVPHDVVALDVGVGPVGIVVRQPELVDRELARIPDQLQARREFG